MKKATGVALVALLIGVSLVGCVADEGSAEPKTITIEEAEGSENWTEVDLTPKKSDSLNAGVARFRMLVPDHYDEGGVEWSTPTGNEEADSLPYGLVMGPDKVVVLAFGFKIDKVDRVITKSYMTDNEGSSKELAELECEPLSHMRTFSCIATFTHTGGTFFGVIETEPAYPEDAAYGPKRAVSSITVQEYGGDSDVCGMVSPWPGKDDELRCLSLPKK